MQRKCVSLAKRSQVVNARTHLFPEGGTEQTRTAPARDKHEDPFSDTEHDMEKHSQKQNN